MELQAGSYWHGLISILKHLLTCTGNCQWEGGRDTLDLWWWAGANRVKLKPPKNPSDMKQNSNKSTVGRPRGTYGFSYVVLCFEPLEYSGIMHNLNIHFFLDTTQKNPWQNRSIQKILPKIYLPKKKLNFKPPKILCISLWP